MDNVLLTKHDTLIYYHISTPDNSQPYKHYMLGMGDTKKFMSQYIMTEIIMIINIITV